VKNNLPLPIIFDKKLDNYYYFNEQPLTLITLSMPQDADTVVLVPYYRYYVLLVYYARSDAESPITVEYPKENIILL